MTQAPALALDLGHMALRLPDQGQPEGRDVLQSIIDLGQRVVDQLKSPGGDTPGPVRAAALGRLRGTGAGVSFGRLVQRLESAHPVKLKSPFEGSEHVGGAVWRGSELLASAVDAALAKLQWRSGARDLPMHTHEHSDRFIIVLEGRGYFHVADETLGAFSGTRVRTVPARERDVFAFTRGVVHTFSTDQSPMTLLSCQLPYLAFDDPRQYTLPEARWSAANSEALSRPGIACDPAWTALIPLSRL